MKRVVPGASGRSPHDRFLRLKARYESRLKDATRAQHELEKRMFHLRTL
jgi:hypothetical protein